MSAALRVERIGPGGQVARVVLDRPDVHNAFDAAMIMGLRRTFEGLADEPAERTRAVVLAGDGPSFSAGADIAWMRAALHLGREENEQDAMALAHMLDAIDRCPAPVIARVHGACLGGGMGLCAVSDLVIAEAGTKFGFTETRLGILPAVIAPFVIAKIGESQARALFPSGRRFDATRACASGSCTRSWRGWTPWTGPWTPRSSRSSRRVPRRPVQRRPSCARSAACPTSRPAGTRPAASPGNVSAPKARKACGPFSSAAGQPGSHRNRTQTTANLLLPLGR
jgi:enoyl-CoA hydratase/carnithine racemase